MVSEVSVEVDVDPEKVLDCLSISDIVTYLIKRDKAGFLEELGDDIEEEISTNNNAIVTASDYFHGDFDLKGFLKEIGPEESQKVFKQLFEEIGVPA